MKKIIVLLFIVTALFSACNKVAQVTEDAVAVSDLPTAVAEGAKSNYPDAVVYSATKVTNGETDYILTLNTQEEAAFKTSGECLGEGSRFHSPLNGRPHGGGFDGHGMMGGHHDGDHDGHGHGHGIGGHHGHELPIDSLPASVTAYMAANYAGFTIRHAELDSLCSIGGVINIAASQQAAPPVHLMFSAAGVYLMKGSRAEYATLPQVVKDYMTANYAGFDTRKRVIQLTLADGTIQYMVFLHKNEQHKNVLIKADGTLLCEH